MPNLRAIALAFTVACGGAATPPPRAAAATTPTPHDDVVVTTSPVASSPPLFTGPFEVESMTDGKKTLVIADWLHSAHLHDGRMTWEIGEKKFKIGMWTMGELEKLDDSDRDPTTTFAEFCRSSGEVSAHWEGPTIVLASEIVADGTGGVVRVHRKVTKGVASRDQVAQMGNCSASFTGTRITFEIVDKDSSGPTRVRASAPGVTVTLVRGRPIASIDPAKVFPSN